jgi:hypothetical protein
MGSSPLSIVSDLHKSYPSEQGLDRDIFLRPYDFRFDDGAALGGATTGSLPYLSTDLNFPAIAFNHTADDQTAVRASFVLPGDFNPLADRVLAGVIYAKVDSGADENADLSIGLGFSYSRLATSYASTSAVDGVSALIATGASTTGTKFQVANVDLSLAARTALKGSAAAALAPNSLCYVDINPNEAVGTTNMKLYVAGVIIRYSSSVAVHDRDLRISRAARIL